MDHVNIYDDINNLDLGSEIHKLEDLNKHLIDHIRKLESDIEKLCTQLTSMKQVQQNLSKNISALFKTAKLELERKNRIISELRAEVDSLTLGKGNKLKRFKRRLGQNANILSAKRVKTELNDVVPDKAEEADNKIDRRSSIDSRRNNEAVCPKNSVRKYERRDEKLTSTNKRNDRFRRSRSGDRYKRSKSNDRYSNRKAARLRKRSRSRDRIKTTANSNYRRSRSIDWKKKYESMARNRRSRSRDYKTSRSKSKGRNVLRNRSDSKSSHLSEASNFVEIKSEYMCSDIKSEQISTFMDELEDGEISPYHDVKVKLETESSIKQAETIQYYNDKDNKDIKLVKVKLETESLIKQAEDIQYDNGEDNKDIKLVSRSDSKPITIEEYRHRQKSTENTDADVINEILETSDKIESSSTNSFSCNSQILNVKCQKNDAINMESHISNKKLEINEVGIDNVKDELEKSEIEQNEHHMPDVINSKTEPFKNTPLHNSNIDTSNLSSDAENISVCSNNTSLNNSGNNRSIRNRRRRCIVIGIKDKT